MGITIDGAGTITGLDADGISAQPVFPGNVLQVVQAVKNDGFSTTSTSLVDLLSLSITPSSASNKILLIMNGSMNNSSDAANRFNLVRNTTSLETGTEGATRNGTLFINSGGSGNNPMQSFSHAILDNPSTTLATTYKVQVSTTNGTLYVNQIGSGTTGWSSSLIAMEIAG